MFVLVDLVEEPRRFTPPFPSPLPVLKPEGSFGKRKRKKLAHEI